MLEKELEGREHQQDKKSTKRDKKGSAKELFNFGLLNKGSISTPDIIDKKSRLHQ